MLPSTHAHAPYLEFFTAVLTSSQQPVIIQLALAITVMINHACHSCTCTLQRGVAEAIRN